MKVPFVDLRAQYKGLEEEMLSLVKGVMDDGDYVYSKKIDKLEEEITEYLGLRPEDRAISVSSGTTALETCLQAAGIKPFDKVLVPSNSFIASAFAVSNAGGIPVFFDIDPDTWVWNVRDVMRYLDKDHSIFGVMPVHLYGLPVPGMERLVEYCSSRRVVVIEDCAQAFGASTEQGNKVGTIGHVNAFSFYPTKNMGTIGNGGLVASKFGFYNKAARLKKNYGESSKYYSDVVGNNYNMSTVQAVVLSLFLRKIDEWNEKRAQAGRWYREAIDASPVLKENLRYQKGPLKTHIYHLFVIEVVRELRDKLLGHLRENDIGAALHYPLAIHEQKAYVAGDISLNTPSPVAEELTKCIVSLPMHPNLTKEQVTYVCSSIEDFFNA